MTLYIYKKKDISVKKKVVNYFSYLSLIIGSLLLFWSFYPILSFEIYSRLFIEKKILTPIPRSEIVSSLEVANSILGSYNAFSSNLRDFTQVNLWFPTRPQINDSKKISLQDYSLSIPKLNIKNAKVIVDGDDLSKGLIHYIPKSLPGEFGNIVILGHSTLPQLYNSSDYKTIFTYLPSLEKGDKILVKFDNIDYEYEVYEMFVINPDKISVLDQKNDASYLTLITCVPPGTYWKRLIVRARLAKLP